MNYSRLLKYLYDHNCERCNLSALLEEGEGVCIPGSGDYFYGGMILGEAPGRNEARGGEPFIGQAGKILNEALDNSGWKREHVFVSNVVKCRPPNNRAPKEVEEAACRIFLIRELNTVKPAVIMTLGNHALRAILGEWGITRFAGKWQALDFWGRFEIKVMPNYHPAYILRNRQLLPAFNENVKFFVKSLTLE